jgi:tRNA pseudouridine55 synthase
MTRRRAPEPPGASGFLVVDKPSGLTSHDVVDAARRALRTRRVGHLGTLDPQATGVLPLAIRDATKLVPFLAAGRKLYRGAIQLGVETDTLDGDGRRTREHEGRLPDEAAVRAALAAFVGEIEQVPPMYSAVKKDGVALHRLARRGQEVERAPRRVRIDRLELLRFAAPTVEIEVACSAGTYVRVLAADLGARLGCGAVLASLRRLASGPFRIEDAIPFALLEQAREAGPADVEARLVPPVTALGLPTLSLGPEAARRIAHGAEIATPPGVPASTRVAALGPDGELLAVLEARPGRLLGPVRVLSGSSRS